MEVHIRIEILLQIGPSTYNKNGGYPKLDHLELHLPCVHKYPDSLSTTQTKNKPLRHRNKQKKNHIYHKHYLYKHFSANSHLNVTGPPCASVM